MAEPSGNGRAALASAPDVPASWATRIASAAPRVHVEGDAVLDRWISGPARRLGREAPVPIVEAEREAAAPGAGANVAVNLAALGGRVSLTSAVGTDPDGALLRSLLEGAGVELHTSVPTAGTSVKRRLVAGDQLIARLDTTPAVEPAAVDSPAARARRGRCGRRHVSADADAVVVTDYGLGAASSARRPRTAGGLLVIDAHDLAPWARLEPDLVTPSIGEAARLLGERPPERDRIGWALDNRAELLRCTGARAVVLTADVDGAVWLPAHGPALHRPAATAVPELRACGAGDTFLAALTLAVSAGADPVMALTIAQSAAEVALGQAGTAVCGTAALAAHLAAGDRGIALDTDTVAAVTAAHRGRGRRVVFTNGCFDVLHRGHVGYLRQARGLGDVLVVALNSDASVRRLKGAGRPLNPLPDRAAVVGALECVDLVTVFDEDSPVELVRRLRPDVYAKGGDYTPQMLPETPVVEETGGVVRVLDYLSDHSTSAIVERIQAGEP